MAIKCSGSVITGMPPVVPALSVKRYKAHSTGVGAGAAVTVGAQGEVNEGNVNGSDIFGITLAAAGDGENVRVMPLVPGMILEGPINAARTAGNGVRYKATDLDEFATTGAEAGIVIRYEADYRGHDHYVWVIPKQGRLF